MIDMYDLNVLIARPIVPGKTSNRNRETLAIHIAMRFMANVSCITVEARYVDKADGRCHTIQVGLRVGAWHFFVSPENRRLEASCVVPQGFLNRSLIKLAADQCNPGSSDEAGGLNGNLTLVDDSWSRPSAERSQVEAQRPTFRPPAHFRLIHCQESPSTQSRNRRLLHR